MQLHHKIFTARTNKGLTQEELADLTQVTVRTIQRIENGENIPRKFTLKAIAAALDIPFQELNTTANRQQKNEAAAVPDNSGEATAHFLQLLCLSCFAYIIVPYLHFLIPAWLLKRSHESNADAVRFGRKIIRIQIYWVISFHLLLLVTLAYNLLQRTYLNNQYVIHYLWPFFMMYFANAMIILTHLSQVRKHSYLTN